MIVTEGGKINYCINDAEAENELYQGSLFDDKCSKLNRGYQKSVKYTEILLIMISNRILRGNNEGYWKDEERFFNEDKAMNVDELAKEQRKILDILVGSIQVKDGGVKMKLNLDGLNRLLFEVA